MSHISNTGTYTRGLDALRKLFYPYFRSSDFTLDLGFIGVRAKPIVEREALQQRRILMVRAEPLLLHLSFFAWRAEDQSPCPECFDRRRLSTLTLEEQWAVQNGFDREESCSPFLMPSVVSFAMILIQHLIANKRKNAQVVVTLDLLTLEVASHELLVDSFCEACQTWRKRSPAKTKLKIRASIPTKRGDGRLKALEDYDLPLNALINPVCGAVGTEAQRGGAQCSTAPIFAHYIQRAWNSKPRVVGWSGLTLRYHDSLVAGILESLERQAGMTRFPNATATVGCFNNVSEIALNPELCLLYNDLTFSHSTELTPYSSTLPIEWTWGYSLVSKRPKLVPKDLVFYEPIRKKGSVRVVENNSNGCALGFCIEEAILKALAELIERDSFMIAWYGYVTLPRIKVETIGNDTIRWLCERMDYLGYNLTLLDARFDLSMPTIIAVARRRDGGIGSMTVGAAANTNATDAIRSALMECASSIVEMPQMFRASEDRIRWLAQDFSRVQTVGDHPLLYALPEMAEKASWLDCGGIARSFIETYAKHQTTHFVSNIGHELSTVVGELIRSGLSEVIAVDITTREQEVLGFKSARVIVPGLAPIDFAHPRNRVEKLPRFRSCLTRAKRAATMVNNLPHPFP